MLLDMPPMADAGYSMFDVNSWHGISGLPGLSEDKPHFWVKLLEEISKIPQVSRDGRQKFETSSLPGINWARGVCGEGIPKVR